jgi:hypothetical protein
MSEEEGELRPLHVEAAPVKLVVDAGKSIRDAVELTSELGAFVLETLVAVYLGDGGQVVESACLFDEGVETSIPCHGLVAATGYSDVHFPYRTAGSSFSIDDLISSPLPTVVARYFFTLLVPSPSFLPFPSPSGTFRSRLPYVLSPSGSLCTLPMCSG